ncbi:thioesterase domain-containing protein [Shewanella eurypsychrophilus]|uniref:Thioesterase domain-containing protein n=1 Tax=Shewanella eurypsychrophilus TaxID=2593656 RepID=A0ABX6VBM0_9GAMM|nr:MULTISPECIES: thioesterase domain-containing protein [Shewanella]QFU24840.1 thioesterase [Shewanella sp. YLB-09]QPG60029.1 thioesterase domain-containing protein [Shewanella eurypsychrophilus]
MPENIDKLLSELQQTWHRTIPVSGFMKIEPVSYFNKEFRVTAPLEPNINLHKTMFAGSIYTLMTLTGWGMVWLQQSLAGLEGDIVLADAKVKYIAPIEAAPVAKVSWPQVDMSVLSKGRRLKVMLEVKLYCDNTCCAIFEGLYISKPKQSIS